MKNEYILLTDVVRNEKTFDAHNIVYDFQIFVDVQRVPGEISVAWRFKRDRCRWSRRVHSGKLEEIIFKLFLNINQKYLFYFRLLCRCYYIFYNTSSLYLNYSSTIHDVV